MDVHIYALGRNDSADQDSRVPPTVGAADGLHAQELVGVESRLSEMIAKDRKSVARA